MTTKAIINYPVEGTILFSDTLRIHYKLSSNLDGNVNKLAFVLNDVVYYDTSLLGTFEITNIPAGEHVLTGYLLDKSNIKIPNTDFDVNFTTYAETLDVENKLTYVLRSTIPDFVKEDYPNFVMFLKAYYEWLYSSNNPFYAPLISEDFKDIDRTPDYFVKFFKEQYLKDFPESLTKDKQTGSPLNLKTLIKNIVSFYSSKGTEKSIKFLLKILYDTYSEIYYPRVDLFKSSESKWIVKKSIKFTSSTDNIYKIKQKELFQKNGETKTWSATIDEIQVYRANNKQIVEVFYSNENGSLNFNYLFQVDTGGRVLVLSPIKVVTDIKIEDGGLFYKINDLIRIQKNNSTQESNDVCLAIVSNVNSYGEILETQIINFLYTQDIPGNYTSTVSSINGTGANFSVEEGYICIYAGYWIDKKSHTDSIKVTQDNFRYQDMSYVIRTDRSLDRYLDPLKKLAHPAGIAVIGDVLIQKTLIEPTEIQDAFVVFFTPLIGNYLAYRINTDVNVRGSPDLFPNGFDPSQQIPDQDGSDSPHTTVQSISTNVSSTVFGFIPAVSDAEQINNYWVVYPHPNTEINTITNDTRFIDIKLIDFLKQER